MAFDPQTDLETLPTDPGVYLMKGEGGAIIYVGKAANLKARVSQYFGASSDTRYFIGLLDDYLVDLDVIITRTEKEALILENELIKRHQPRFNVELKDDKNFLHLRLDDRVKWPRIDVVRSPRKDGAKYFGPYHSASKIRETLKLVERHFQLRNCDDLSFKNRSRPCLQYQIKRCPAPCVLPVDKAAYHAQVNDVSLFLRGRHDELVKTLRAQMLEASEQMDYERAARYRDRITAVQGSLEVQSMVGRRAVDRDIFGTFREGGSLQIAVLFVRGGRMVGSRSFGPFEEQGRPDAEVLSTFCNLFYNRGHEIPMEICCSVAIEGADALAERLGELRGRRVVVKVPQRGDGKRLLEMAARNAEHAFLQARRSEASASNALKRLKSRLRLSNLPVAIECFDISIFQGDSAVASQVRFESGRPHRAGYRRYKIKEVEGTDDFAMMREVLTRRLKRGLDEGDMPDLIVVDGGKGQLNVAVAVMQDLEVSGIDVVGLAKARVLAGGDDGKGGVARSFERVFLPGVKDPILLRPHTDELFVMTALRDEAHRFAITFHRKLRKKKHFASALDEIPGVGPARKRRLLKTFGSLSRLSQADEAEIAAVSGIGPQLATAIKAGLAGA